MWHFDIWFIDGGLKALQHGSPIFPEQKMHGTHLHSIGRQSDGMGYDVQQTLHVEFEKDKEYAL